LIYAFMVYSCWYRRSSRTSSSRSSICSSVRWTCWIDMFWLVPISGRCCINLLVRSIFTDIPYGFSAASNYPSNVWPRFANCKSCGWDGIWYVRHSCLSVNHVVKQFWWKVCLHLVVIQGCYINYTGCRCHGRYRPQHSL